MSDETPTIIVPADRVEWLKRRRETVGASEAAALFNLHPYHSPYSLWVEKTSDVPPTEEMNDIQAFGHAVEPFIADKYGRETGNGVITPPPMSIFLAPNGLKASATPDRFRMKNQRMGVLELKSGMHFDPDSEVPAVWQVQTQQQMLCTSMQDGDLAIMGSFHKFFIAGVERNDAFIALLIEKIEEFWHWVKVGTPPPLDGHAATTEAIRRLHPKDSGDTVDLPPEAAKWSALLPGIDEAISRLTLKREAIRNYIAEKIGPATQGRLSSGDGWTFKTQKKQSYVVKDQEFRVLRRTHKAIKELPRQKKEITGATA